MDIAIRLTITIIAHTLLAGTGLGVFTVAAASKNHPVLAVEPSMDLAKLIHQTVQANSLVNVTLVTDALGDQVGAGRLSGSNAGDMRVRPVSLSDIGRDVSNLVRIIRLDDLLPLVTFRRAVIKLGNLGEDSKVLKGARRFVEREERERERNSRSHSQICIYMIVYEYARVCALVRACALVCVWCVCVCVVSICADFSLRRTCTIC